MGAVSTSWRRALGAMAIAAMASLLLAAACAPARACDLDEVIGYQLITARVIEAYIDPGQHQQMGFEGCAPGRVLVFTDHSGVRCKAEGRQHLVLPKAWLFARGRDDMRLCVGDDIYSVGPLR